MENYPKHNVPVIAYYKNTETPVLARFWILDNWATFVTIDSNYEEYLRTKGDTFDYEPLNGEISKWAYLPTSWNFLE